MEHFATRGYEAARIEEIAAEAGVSKGAVFGYFETKAGLFLAAYQAAARSFPAYLDAPAGGPRGRASSRSCGYWIERHPAPHPRGLDPVPGHPDRQLLRGAAAAPGDHPVPGRARTRTARRAFVRFGIDRGEVRQDIDPRMIVSMVDWLMDRVQDAMVTEELDPGLFGYRDPAAGASGTCG